MNESKKPVPSLVEGPAPAEPPTQDNPEGNRAVPLDHPDHPRNQKPAQPTPAPSAGRKE